MKARMHVALAMIAGPSPFLMIEEEEDEDDGGALCVMAMAVVFDVGVVMLA
jgi:hypothetical protein